MRKIVDYYLLRNSSLTALEDKVNAMISKGKYEPFMGLVFDGDSYIQTMVKYYELEEDEELPVYDFL